jgi:hypothetical protein
MSPNQKKEFLEKFEAPDSTFMEDVIIVQPESENLIDNASKDLRKLNNQGFLTRFDTATFKNEIKTLSSLKKKVKKSKIKALNGNSSFNFKDCTLFSKEPRNKKLIPKKQSKVNQIWVRQAEEISREILSLPFFDNNKAELQSNEIITFANHFSLEFTLKNPNLLMPQENFRKVIDGSIKE